LLCSPLLVAQANALPFLVSLILLAVALTLKANYSSLGLAVCLNPLLRKAGVAEVEDTHSGKVSFLVAIRSNLLWGPASYSLADNPYYADAFSNRHWNPAVRQLLRADARRQRPSQPSLHAKTVRSAEQYDSDDDVDVVTAALPDMVSAQWQADGFESPAQPTLAEVPPEPSEPSKRRVQADPIADALQVRRLPCVM